MTLLHKIVLRSSVKLDSLDIYWARYCLLPKKPLETPFGLGGKYFSCCLHFALIQSHSILKEDMTLQLWSDGGRWAASRAVWNGPLQEAALRRVLTLPPPLWSGTEREVAVQTTATQFHGQVILLDHFSSHPHSWGSNLGALHWGKTCKTEVLSCTGLSAVWTSPETD